MNARSRVSNAAAASTIATLLPETASRCDSPARRNSSSVRGVRPSVSPIVRPRISAAAGGEICSAEPLSPSLTRAATMNTPVGGATDSESGSNSARAPARRRARSKASPPSGSNHPLPRKGDPAGAEVSITATPACISRGRSTPHVTVSNDTKVPRPPTCSSTLPSTSQWLTTDASASRAIPSLDRTEAASAPHPKPNRATASSVAAGSRRRALMTAATATAVAATAGRTAPSAATDAPATTPVATSQTRSSDPLIAVSRSKG